MEGFELFDVCSTVISISSIKCVFLAISNKDGIKRIRNIGYAEFAVGLEPFRNGEVFWKNNNSHAKLLCTAFSETVPQERTASGLVWGCLATREKALIPSYGVPLAKQTNKKGIQVIFWLPLVEKHWVNT